MESVSQSPGLISSEQGLIQLQNLVTSGDQAEVCAFFDALEAVESAHYLASFPPDKRHLLWQCVPKAEQGTVLAELSDEVRSSILQEMDGAEIAFATTDLPAESLAEILDTAHIDQEVEVLKTLDPVMLDRVERIRRYEDHQVGRYMHLDSVNIKETVTLETVQRFIRISGRLHDEDQSLLVTNQQNQLVGALSLVDLVKQPQEDLVREHLETPFALHDEMDIHEAATLVKSKGIKYAPVVNANNELVGQLTTEDILEMTRDDSEATLMNMSRVSEDDELFASIGFSAKSRGSWLGINLLTAFLAAYVIGQFEAVLSQVVALAVLMPVVASMGGIAGSQTLTVMIRGLAMGQVGGNNRKWLLNKELWVGLINGIVWAVVVGLVAQLWFGQLSVSLVIALAIVINMTVANLSGVVIPLILRKAGVDPALSGAVILTTVTDVVGFMSFLGLATLMILQ